MVAVFNQFKSSIEEIIEEARNGRMFVPINFRLSRDEVAYIVEHCGARALLVDPEIADTMGVSPNSVKTHLKRGLAALEDRLEGTR